MKKILLSVIALVLTACNAQSIKPNHQLSETENKGVILVSASQDFNLRGSAAYSLFYINHEVGGQFAFIKSKQKTLSGLGLNFENSDFTKTYGKLYVFDAPAGNYIINSWAINNGTGARITPRKKPSGIKFTVKKGEVAYIGNLHMKFATGKNPFGVTITGGGYPLILDEFDRDYKLFTKRYSNLSKAPFSKQIPFTGPWIKN